MTANPSSLMLVALLMFGITCVAGFLFVCKNSSHPFVLVALVCMIVCTLFAAALQKLGYVVLAKDIRVHLGLLPSALSVTAFIALVVALARRFQTDKLVACVAILLGGIFVLLASLPLLIYIGCEYSECINL